MSNLQITNSLSKKKEVFKPINPKKISLYACGPTVYDNPHVGNARSLVVFDVLFRVLRSLYDNNVTSASIYLSAVNSLSNDDVKLSERLYIPSRRLRGFQSGRVGPKDNNDYIGGNYTSVLNLTSTLPQILENNQTTDFAIFLDVANIWGVDYDSSIDDQNKIRSAVGFGVDWFTPIGPLNFSLAAPISKASTDETETFRFNLGTTF